MFHFYQELSRALAILNPTGIKPNLKVGRRR